MFAIFVGQKNRQQVGSKGGRKKEMGDIGKMGNIAYW